MFAQGRVETFSQGRLLDAGRCAVVGTMDGCDPMRFTARFRVVGGREDELCTALKRVADPTRAEPGCLAFAAFRSRRDPTLFFVQSTWTDEAAFDNHSRLPHTVAFVAEVEQLVAEPPEFVRLLQVV